MATKIELAAQAQADLRKAADALAAIPELAGLSHAALAVASNVDALDDVLELSAIAPAPVAERDRVATELIRQGFAVKAKVDEESGPYWIVTDTVGGEYRFRV